MASTSGITVDRKRPEGINTAAETNISPFFQKHMHGKPLKAAWSAGGQTTLGMFKKNTLLRIFLDTTLLQNVRHGILRSSSPRTHLG
jgi:hypothetical protein